MRVVKRYWGARLILFLYFGYVMRGVEGLSWLLPLDTPLCWRFVGVLFRGKAATICSNASSGLMFCFSGKKFEYTT